MTDRNLTIRIALVLGAIIGLLAILTQFSSRDDDAAASAAGAVPVAATKVERPKPAQLGGDPLLTPPRRAARLATAVVIDGQIEPLDSAAFRHAQILIRLRHLAGLSRDAVCRGEDGALWSCGLQGRAALVNTLRSSRARCLPALDTPGEKDSFQCWVGEDDLSRLMIRNGWAMPAPLQASRYLGDMEAATAAKAGVWRGGWPTGDAVAPPPLPEGRTDIARP